MKQNFGDVTGTCPICTINLWSGCGNMPAVFPCGVAKCPYEAESKQLKIEFSKFGSSLAQLMES